MKSFTDRSHRVASVLVTIALALAGLGGSANAGSSGPAATAASARSQPLTVVNAILSDDMRITLDRYSAPAGDVYFLVTNAGRLEHELVVLKTDLAFDRLPARAEEAGKVEEEVHFGETGDMAGGRFSGLGLQLAPGNYVILCNELGHYMAGMRVAFTVTPPVVNVSLDDRMTITLDQTTFYAGQVVFAVSNRGAVEHELVVLATNASADEIPADTEEAGRVSEETNIGETGDIPGGRFSGLGIDLAPGVYMLICNEAGHFAAGMHIQILVLPAPSGDE
jgi:uncharacterized cupredoxin-like copper-binding protein